MSERRKGIPAGASAVIPRLFRRDPVAEIEFCKATFGAEEGVLLVVLEDRRGRGRGRRLGLAEVGECRGGLGIAEGQRVGDAVEDRVLSAPDLVELRLVELADLLEPGFGLGLGDLGGHGLEAAERHAEL